MRKISLWAKHHPFPAITSIIVIKILLAVIAFYIGSALLAMNIRIPFIVCIIALIVLATTVFLYPARYLTRLSKKQFYTRQKCCDLAIALCSFVMIGTLVNTNFTMPHSVSLIASNTVASNPPTAEEILSSLQHRDKKSFTKKEKRILKQEFKKQLKIFAVAKVSGKKNNGDKALLIILTIIAAVGLFFLLAALACSIACSGAEGAAVAVAIIGTVGIIWGTVAIIRRIKRGPEKNTEYLPKPDQSL
jgi:hypothetical protein